MKVIEDLKSGTMDNLVKNLAGNVTESDADESISYVDFKKCLPKYNAKVIQKKISGKFNLGYI